MRSLRGLAASVKTLVRNVQEEFAPFSKRLGLSDLVSVAVVIIMIIIGVVLVYLLLYPSGPAPYP